MQLALPPPPRLVGPAHGHVWVVRPGGDEALVCRLSDGRPFQHQVGASILDVVYHAASPLLILVTARGLVRLHCFAHALTLIESPWLPGAALAQLVVGEDIALLGMAEHDDEPWRVPIAGANAPPLTLESPDTHSDPLVGALDRPRGVRHRMFELHDSAPQRSRERDDFAARFPPAAADPLDSGHDAGRATTAGLDTERPEAARFDTGRTDPARGDSARSDSGPPGAAHFDTRRAEIDRGDTARSDFGRPGAARFDMAHLEADGGDGGRSDTGRQGAARFGIGSTEADGGDAARSDTGRPGAARFDMAHLEADGGDAGRSDSGRPESARFDIGRTESERGDGGRPEGARHGRPEIARLDLGRGDVGRADVARVSLDGGNAGDAENGRASLWRADAARFDMGRSDAGRPGGWRGNTGQPEARGSEDWRSGLDAGRSDAGRSDAGRGEAELRGDGGAGEWREVLAAFGEELARGGVAEVPGVESETELGQLADRLGLGAAARRALVVMYGVYLVGEPALAIARLAAMVGEWGEALGRGDLGSLAMLRRRGGRVALRSAVTDVLDGVGPRAIRLVGDGTAHARPGAVRMARDGRADEVIERELAAQLGRIAVIDGGATRAVLEARLHGATAVALTAPAVRPLPWPRDAGLIVVTEASAPAWAAALPGFTGA
ncbi:MAG TPA: hypothetical protein VFD36_23870 [Kofleriaceae bacterium]|nr:hypothetical protein [Kofleriaceae bacterium]